MLGRRLMVGLISVGRDNWRDLSVEVGITAVRAEEFVMIRQLLEIFKDFLILAEVCFSPPPLSTCA